MAYKFRHGYAIGEEVQRIAYEQIDAALAEIASSELDDDATVHAVRKRCKKLRGLLRLVRPQLGRGQYAHENAWYRDTARRLSSLRDAYVVLASLQKLRDRFAGAADDGAFESLHDALCLRFEQQALPHATPGALLAQVAALLEDGRERVPTLRVAGDVSAAIHGGFARTYKRARGAMRAAYASGAAADFHEWRKRAKYHGYHLKLLRHAWQESLHAVERQARDLSDLLGDDHDLAALREAVQTCADDVEDGAAEAVNGLISAAQAELRSAAAPLGARLFAEKPRTCAARFERYWRALSIEAAAGRRNELPAGEAAPAS